jgi:hypothetical protein
VLRGADACLPAHTRPTARMRSSLSVWSMVATTERRRFWSRCIASICRITVRSNALDGSSLPVTWGDGEGQRADGNTSYGRRNLVGPSAKRDRAYRVNPLLTQDCALTTNPAPLR